jgi:ribulose-phosphate 3-epimerase
VKDNHYVPNLTIGPLVCQAIRPHVAIALDVHLMVEPVDALIPLFAAAGADHRWVDLAALTRWHEGTLFEAS